MQCHNKISKKKQAVAKRTAVKCQAHANCMTQHVTVHWHSSWALLFHLQEATHKNAQRKLTNARCPDHALCRTRSAHAGAGMLFNVQRSQEFIFCLAENHFHDESSLGLSMDLACHLELSELRAHRTTPRMSATAWPHLRSMPPPRPRPGRRKQRPWRPAHGKHVSDLLCPSWSHLLCQRGHMHCNHRRVCTQPDRCYRALSR